MKNVAAFTLSILTGTHKAPPAIKKRLNSNMTLYTTAHDKHNEHHLHTCSFQLLYYIHLSHCTLFPAHSQDLKNTVAGQSEEGN